MGDNRVTCTGSSTDNVFLSSIQSSTRHSIWKNGLVASPGPPLVAAEPCAGSARTVHSFSLVRAPRRMAACSQVLHHSITSGTTHYICVTFWSGEAQVLLSVSQCLCFIEAMAAARSSAAWTLASLPSDRVISSDRSVNLQDSVAGIIMLSPGPVWHNNVGNSMLRFTCLFVLRERPPSSDKGV